MIDQRTYNRYAKRMTLRKFTQFTHEEAMLCPAGKPLWMYRLEMEEGIALRRIIHRELSVGVCLSDIARSIDVHRDTLMHWVKKLNIMSDEDENSSLHLN